MQNMHSLNQQPRVFILLAMGMLLTLGLWMLLGDRLAGAGATVVTAEIVVTETPFAAATEPCTGGFVATDLPHITQAPGETTRLFDSNGAGLAVGDLDGDGADDIVLANLSGPASILWNQGDLHFEKQSLAQLYRARTVAIVDVNGDGQQDIVFAGGSATPAFLENRGERAFKLAALPGVTKVAYALNWSDLEGDGDLDLVTGSYDSGRMMETGANYLFEDGAGVNVYRNENGVFARTRLVAGSQALAVSLWDLNGDHLPDIWVGNDFDEPDRVWFQQADGAWAAAMPFGRYSHSTMGIEAADITGDGQLDFFTTDMKPYVRDPKTSASWLPLMQPMYKERTFDDPQISENVLQVRSGERFKNQAYDRRIDASGWSWSGKFGDLDTDGDLDLYVVNGMIAADLLHHLPGDELVEENRALRNDGSGHFEPVTAWGLGSTRSGRGMSMADFDRDGDLDIVVNNLNTPAQLFENRLCGAGAALEIDLRQPGTANPFAVGAIVTVETNRGNLLRDVRAVSGYLSGDTSRLHVGLAGDTLVTALEVRWPDGAISRMDAPVAGQLLTITRR
jgi:hypothetical protein